MRVLLIAIFSCLVAVTSSAQLSSSENKKLTTAVQNRKAGEFEKAAKVIDKLLSKYPDHQELLLEKGMIYLNQNNMADALEPLERAWELAPESSYKLTFTLVNIYMDQDRHDDALNMLSHFMNFKNLRPKEIETARKLGDQILFIKKAMANPVPFDPEKLSDKINTDDSEYLPAFTADGETLIFTRRIGRQEDFYLSFFDGENFVDAIPLEELNTGNNEGAHCISPSGKHIFFTACDRQGSIGGCDLYITLKKDGVWVEPINLGPGVNTRAWDAQPSLSPDGNRLYFASTRKGGLGKSDIWYIDLINGVWTDPINAGPAINTDGNEESPFIHLDGETLYFRSDGHLGMGKHDIFLSRKVNGEWSKAENLGYPINTKADEGALTVSTDGMTAYYASDVDNETPHLDILKFELPEEMRPKPASFFKATVFDKVTKAIIPNAFVEIFDLGANKTFNKDKVDENGQVIASIPNGQGFAIHVEAPGYLFFSRNLNWQDSIFTYDAKAIDLYLEPIPAVAEDESAPIIESAPVILNNIFFESGSADLLISSNHEIEKLAALLKEKEDLKIRIIGHTDNVGNDEDNMSLSFKRANEVKKALVFRGIDILRIDAEGKGESMPIADNDTPEGRQANRRTEFVLISKAKK